MGKGWRSKEEGPWAMKAMKEPPTMIRAEIHPNRAIKLLRFHSRSLMNGG
jgi:hypothetical protein